MFIFAHFSLSAMEYLKESLRGQGGTSYVPSSLKKLQQAPQTTTNNQKPKSK
jgi:hypothetical protein